MPLLSPMNCRKQSIVDVIAGASCMLSKCLRTRSARPPAALGRRRGVPPRGRVAALGFHGKAQRGTGSARRIEAGRVSAGPDSRPLGRSRREREPVPRRVFQQVKLTENEQQQLRARAAAAGGVGAAADGRVGAGRGDRDGARSPARGRRAVRGPPVAGDGREQRQPARAAGEHDRASSGCRAGWRTRSRRSRRSSGGCGR